MNIHVPPAFFLTVLSYLFCHYTQVVIAIMIVINSQESGPGGDRDHVSLVLPTTAMLPATAIPKISLALHVVAATAAVQKRKLIITRSSAIKLARFQLIF